MKEYIMIFRNEKMDSQPSAEQMQMGLQQWQTWISNIAKDGKYSGTNRLVNEGKTVKPNNVITDGPYMEGKEMVGGYLVIKAASLDEALKVAQSCPNLIYGGNLELREVMTIDDNPSSKTFLHPIN